MAASWAAAFCHLYSRALRILILLLFRLYYSAGGRQKLEINKQSRHAHPPRHLRPPPARHDATPAHNRAGRRAAVGPGAAGPAAEGRGGVRGSMWH